MRSYTEENISVWNGPTKEKEANNRGCVWGKRKTRPSRPSEYIHRFYWNLEQHFLLFLHKWLRRNKTQWVISAFWQNIFLSSSANLQSLSSTDTKIILPYCVHHLTNRLCWESSKHTRKRCLAQSFLFLVSDTGQRRTEAFPISQRFDPSQLAAEFTILQSS